MSPASMAARIERLPLSAFHRRFVSLIALGGWFDFYDIFMMAYIGAAMQHAGFISRDEFGWVIAAGFFGMFIGTVIFGMGSDRFGRRTAFLWMLLIYSGFTLLSAFAQNAWSLILLRALAGVGIGAELVVIDTYVTEMVPSRARGRYVAITQVVGFTAIPVVAYLSKQLVPVYWWMEGWRWVMVIGSIGALLVWYLRRNLPESPRWLEVAGRHQEAEQVMRDIEERVVKTTGQPLPEPAYLKADAAKAIDGHKNRSAAEKVRLLELWQPLYRGRTLMLMVFHLLQTIGIYGFANWAPTFLLAQGNGLDQSLEYGFWIALVSPVGPLLAVLTTEYFQRRKAIVILALLMAGSGMLFPFSQSGAMIVATGALLTIFSYWFSALLHAYQAELFPTRARATGVGFTYSWSRLSAMFSTLIIAALLSQGVVAVFVFMGAAMVGVALVVGLFGPDTNAVMLEEISG